MGLGLVLIHLFVPISLDVHDPFLGIFYDPSMRRVTTILTFGDIVSAVSGFDFIIMVFVLGIYSFCVGGGAVLSSLGILSPLLS